MELTLALNAANADLHRRVGYASASQFSREYGRFFGNPPAKDIGRLRGEGIRAEAAPGQESGSAGWGRAGAGLGPEP